MLDVVVFVLGAWGRAELEYGSVCTVRQRVCVLLLFHRRVLVRPCVGSVWIYVDPHRFLDPYFYIFGSYYMPRWGRYFERSDD